MVQEHDIGNNSKNRQGDTDLENFVRLFVILDTIRVVSIKSVIIVTDEHNTRNENSYGHSSVADVGNEANPVSVTFVKRFMVCPAKCSAVRQDPGQTVNNTPISPNYIGIQAFC